MLDIRLRRVRRTDWPWLQSWFRDEVLNRELGPINDAWLEHVLIEEDGVQLVAQSKGTPCALVGTLWAPDPCDRNTLTDIAVDPGRRSQGIGRSVLRAVQNWCHVPPGKGWEAFVSARNEPAQLFLRSAGWLAVTQSDGMICFRSDDS